MSDPTFLATRDAVHHAAQVAAALGATWIPADPAHQYANLGWDPRHRALLGREVEGLQAGIALAEGCWIVVRDDARLAARPIAGATLADGLDWVAGVAAANGLAPRPLAVPGYALPDHPVAAGAAFGPLDPDGLARLDRIYAEAAAHLGELDRARLNASPVRCWPHHFDIATLISVDGGDTEHGRSIGVGMTPGDGGIPEPYYYVTPWPYPISRVGPALPAGHWHTAVWFGAVLTESERDGSASQVRLFLAAGIGSCREILDRKPPP